MSLSVQSNQALAPDTGGLRRFFDQNRFLIVFAALSSFMGVSVGMAQVATSLYAVSLGASGTMLGLIAGAQSIGVLVVSLPVGALVDRFGPAKPFVAGTLLAGLTYAAVPLFPAPWYLLLCTTLISFFMPFRFVSLNTVFLQQLATLGENKAGWYRGTHMVGMFLIGPAVGARVVQSLGFDAQYWLIAAAFGITIFVSPMVFARYGGGGAKSRAKGLRVIVEQLRLLATDRELRRVSTLECLTQATGAYFTFFVVVLAVKSAGLSAPEASSLVSAKGVTFILALFVLGGALARLGPRRGLVASLGAIALGLLLVGLGRPTSSLWAGSLLLGLGLGAVQIVNLTRYARLGARRGHGTVSGLNALVGPSGGVFGSFAGGVVGKWIGLGPVFLLGAAGFAIAALAVLLGVNSRERA